jgi:outer membrane protein OmpA-like peptidoglycan-associated protein
MNKILFVFVVLLVSLTSCKTWREKHSDSNQKTGMNKKEKGAVVGASTGAVIGGIVGNRNDNTVLGAILGAAVGGSAGVIIGSRMDKQAKKMEQDLGKAATVERIGEGIKLTFNSQILFDFGKTDLKDSNKKDLQKLAETLKENPGTDLLVVGHTDDIGTEDFNQVLSEKRANAVANYLVDNGISTKGMLIQGWGETQPSVLNNSEESRSQNRRVEIAIYANDTMKMNAQKEAEGKK